MQRGRKRLIALAILAALVALGTAAYFIFWSIASQTEQWRPVPAVIDPGPFVARAPPTDAIVLFDGANLSQWQSMDGSPARWQVDNGIITVNKDVGNIQTRRRFLDFDLHIEWRIPSDITGKGQLRGNSGLFLASTGSRDQGYELQILDSYRNPTYVNGQAGAIYKQFAPLLNPARRPGEWQSYDVAWTAPRFAANGALKYPAHMSVRMNGILVQDNVALKGETVFLGEPVYREHGPAPVKLQAHRDPSSPISFRNIWLRERRQ